MRLTASLISFLTLVAAETTSHIYIRADTSGCGKTHNSGFNDDAASHTIVSGGMDRTYAVRVPDGYNSNPSQQRKVIFDFHGHNGSPAGQYNNSQYDRYAAGAQYLAVYPAGVDAAWQGAPYAAQGVNDTLFVKDLLAHLRTQYCIDSSHVYASGKSNGGGFVDTLACSEQGNEFAAFAMAAAALYTDNSQASCTKKRAILESHGYADDTIPYLGSDSRGLPNVGHWVDWWGHRNGCTNSQKTVTSQGSYSTTTFSCGGLTNVVNHYNLTNEGHCWPDTAGDNTDGTRSYCVDHSLDFTSKVLDFFSKWSLASAPQN